MELSDLAPPGTVLIPILDRGQSVALHPLEAELVARAGDKRRRDFALGRACARAALAALEFPEAPIGRAESGMPLWPQGVVGSITHTSGLAAALVGRGSEFRALGIDAERSEAMDETLAPRLFVPSELALLSALDAPRRREMATLLFSAKEAYYKLFHPLTGRRLDFRRLEIVPGASGFTARQPQEPDGWAEPIAGRFAVMDGLVVTVIGLSVS